MALCLAFGGAQQACADSTAAEPRLGLNIFGLSHHWNRDFIHREKVDNEHNWGLGLNWELERRRDARTFLDIGFYRDSGRNIARYGGGGWQGRLGDSDFFLGAAMVLFRSRTYYEDRPFVAPVPLLSYEMRAARVTLFHFIKYEKVNHVAVTGVYFTLPVR